MPLRLPKRLHWALQSSCISLLSSWYNRGGGGGVVSTAPRPQAGSQLANPTLTTAPIIQRLV